jgi:hypothetical protein
LKTIIDTSNMELWPGKDFGMELWKLFFWLGLEDFEPRHTIQPTVKIQNITSL